jgi:ribosomal protein S18 acetylase RimI-like enzyme
MKIRTAVPEDFEKIKTLYREVAGAGAGLARLQHEITDDYVHDFLDKSLSHGLIIVAENPDNEEALIGEVHGYRPGIEVFKHVLSNITIAVHPEFQGKKIGRTLFTIFLEEVGLHMHDIGRVELIVRESNEKAIRLYQSLGFSIEGRYEMRIRTPDNNYEADIPMGWQNPNFEFD